MGKNKTNTDCCENKRLLCYDHLTTLKNCTVVENMYNRQSLPEYYKIFPQITTAGKTHTFSQITTGISYPETVKMKNLYFSERNLPHIRYSRLQPGLPLYSRYNIDLPYNAKLPCSTAESPHIINDSPHHNTKPQIYSSTPSYTTNNSKLPKYRDNSNKNYTSLNYKSILPQNTTQQNISKQQSKRNCNQT